MPIASLALDEWSGVFCTHRSIDEPSWEQIDEAINALDASRHTLLTLDGLADDLMTIGGGSGRYVVIYQVGEDVFWNLHADGDPAETIMLDCGGQEGGFPADQIVGLDLARAAARTMLAVGGIDVGLGWKRQD